MTAATEGRNTKRRNAESVGHPVNAGNTVFAGTLVALLTAGGNAVPAGTAASGDAVGVAESTVLGDGVQIVEARRGCFLFANSLAGDQIARADIHGTAYVVDDQTVAKTDNTGVRKVAGKIIDVDATGVWVLVG
ncbi:MAG: hypothetical protein GAK28_00698 [Luteibacter sp.]|uniref:hypothetical protein n=1 Tax=Luteibacter sp. TaxID=1886636 RepID=UPI0013805DB8|nr:hypothetical protein [Luteibacter sp.]KAF1009065.1 MAG: hypothetical protein GAK28_00698 [Luteibacter sp.]